MAETIKFIGGIIARKLGGKFEKYYLTYRDNITYASAYLADDLDLSDTAAWYEIGSGAETITVEKDLGGNFSATTGRYTCPVAGIYESVFRVGCKVKDDSKTLISFLIGLGVGGTASTVGFRFYGDPLYYIGGTAVFKTACAIGTTLSCVVYAAESAGSQPTIFGGADDNLLSFNLVSSF